MFEIALVVGIILAMIVLMINDRNNSDNGWEDE